MDNLPYNLIDTIEQQGGSAAGSRETGAWVPFTMRVDAEAVLRRAGAPGAAADRRPPADDRPGAQRLTASSATTCTHRSTRRTPRTCRSAMQDIDQAKSLLKQAGQSDLHVQLFTGDDIGRVAPASRPPCSSSRPRRPGVDGQGRQEEPLLRRPTTCPTLRPGLLEHPQLPPAGGRVRRSRAAPTTRPTSTTRSSPALIDQAQAASSTRPSATSCCTQAQEIEYNEGGYIIWGFRTPARRVLEPARSAAASSREPVPAARSTTTSRTRPSSSLTELSHGRRRDTRSCDPLDEVAPPRGAHGALGAGCSGWPAASGLAVLTLWLVSILVFFATAALGDPVRAILGKDYASSPERVAAARRAQLNLDQSVIVALLRLARRPAHRRPRHLDRQPAAGRRADRAPTSSTPLVLVLISAIVMIPVAFGIAMISANYRGKRPDTVIQTCCSPWPGCPSSSSASCWWRSSPPRSSTAARRSPSSRRARHPWDQPEVDDPAGRSPWCSRWRRTSPASCAPRLLEVLDSDYVELARLKGIPETGGDAQARPAQRRSSRASR